MTKLVTSEDLIREYLFQTYYYGGQLVDGDIIYRQLPYIEIRGVTHEKETAKQ